MEGDIKNFSITNVNQTYNGVSSNGLLLPVHKTRTNQMSELFFLIQNGIIPERMKYRSKQLLKTLIEWYVKGEFTLSPKVQLTPSMIGKLSNGSILNYQGIDFGRNAIIKSISDGKANKEITDIIVHELLQCDKKRVDIDAYDAGQVMEINRGHWELWKNQEKNTESIKIPLDYPLVARNPIADINRKGMVGIDFGTKSTVVVLLDDQSRIHQMRIGNGNLKKEVKKSDYENPTVMEFRNIEDFMKRYQEKKGRPDTLWNDITISHTAVDSLQNAQNSQEYYSFFSDLKQWANDSERKIRIKDMAQHEEVLPSFLELGKEALNPIEIYAYYLGLAINNMRNGIYMDYMLSYPVNYPVKVRNKIVESFERGLKKSLPEQLLNDEESMRLFRVQAGVSEPAAYAISALKGYGFAPEGEEKIFYGIFDFGGGTTDFDFGIWRGAKEKESRRADYVIEHFGAGGDRYLGGENLLELLAFEVFKKNQKIMLENELTFFKPAECAPFSGSELLISSSQEAKLNTRQLMEKLRCFWESGVGIELPEVKRSSQLESELNAIREGAIKVSLFDKKGHLHPNLELKVEEAELQKIVTDRIRVGVVNFFEAIKNTFHHPAMQEVNKFHIFLAGNSCKSPIVNQLFVEMIAEENSKIEQYYQKKGISIQVDDFFEIYPALGTEAAEEKKKELGISDDSSLEEYEKPTGKTGVAYGLLEGRAGSRIKVVSEIASKDETKFGFYIGYEKKGKFHVEMDRDVEYRKWIEFIDAYETDFELFYTSLPEATTNQMEITRVKRMPCRIQNTYEDDTINVYLRTIEPDVIEYVVASDTDVQKEVYLEGPYRIKLEE